MTLSVRASVPRRREAAAALLLLSLALAAACWGAAGPAFLPGAALACSRSLHHGNLEVQAIIDRAHQISHMYEHKARFPMCTHRLEALPLCSSKSMRMLAFFMSKTDM